MMIANKMLRVVFLPILLLGWMAGCASDSAVIGQAAQMHDGIEPAVITDPTLANYIQQVGGRVIEVARELHRQNYGPESHKNEDASWMFGSKMRFHLVNSKTVNAFTSGGEHMYMYTGLMEKCKTEDELAAVVAHEFAHVYARHIHKGMNRQYAILGGAAALGATGYAVGGKENRAEYAAAFAGAGLLAGKFVGMGFTRDDEAEADKLGFKFYTMAGWDPNQFGNFFQTMVDMGFDKTPEMMSDHPTLKSRVKDAKRRAGDLPPQAREWRRPPVADPAQFQQLIRRAQEVGKTMPSDKSLGGAQELLAAVPRSCLTPVVTDEHKQAQKKLAEDVKKAQQEQKK